MNRTRKIACQLALSSAVILAACGGGGGGSSSTGSGAAPAGSAGPGSTGSGTPPVSTPGTNPGPAASSSFMLPYRIGNEVIPSRLPHIAIDAAGGVHAVYAANAADNQGRRPAYYAYCAADCSGTDRFSTVALGDGLGDAQIQLTSAGQPRILLATQPTSVSTVQYEYWSCDSNCLQSAGWRQSVVVEAGTPFFPSDSENTQSFALDAQGRPRFIFQSNSIGTGSALNGVLFASCDSGCTSATQWRLAQLDENLWKNASLAIDPQGLPRIAYSMMQAAEPWAVPVIGYMECATRDCSAGVSRQPLAITTTDGTLSTATFSMRLTTSGAPRIALYPGTGAGGEFTPNALYYLSCDAACAQATSVWGALDVGLPAAWGQEGVDLALDSRNRPRIALRIPVPVDELAYVWCDAQCETSALGWHNKPLPSAKAAETEMGLPARMGCPQCIPPIPPCPSAYWLAGFWPSITLDRNGNPVIGYEVQLQAGGGACSVGVMARVPRLMAFEQPR